MNAIEYGKLKIIARVGELCPAMTRQEAGSQGGRGHEKGASPGEAPFAPRIIAAYRKVAKHRSELVAEAVTLTGAGGGDANGRRGDRNPGHARADGPAAGRGGTSPARRVGGKVNNC
jgi:hypothetical protein